mmetsp:Transcript_19606/g.45597  ORF Transcript_19606/g.45597 Transcript_19606/m.45597 type:complete len:467 (+) Transcript_19606:54-1454(+)
MAAERKQLRPAKKAEDVDSEQGTGGLYGAVHKAAADPEKWLKSVARWLETSDATDPVRNFTLCCDDFRPRRLKAPVVLAWLVVQILGLLFQVILWLEVGRNLEAFEDTLAQNCAPALRQHDICLGPAWNLSYSGSLVFPPSESQADFDYVIPKTQSFSFRTASHPPTFLLGIQPQPPHASAQWQVALHPAGKSSFFPYPAALPSHGWGSRYSVVSSKKEEPAWEGTINLRTKYSEEARIDVFVVDSRIAHLEDIHQQKQCSFEGSWQNFSERGQGKHHRVLSFVESATGFFLMVQLILAGIVLRRFFLFVDTGKLLSRVIVFKFFVQDFAQQMCIAAYLFAWYADNGLRCQMCLFHPSHCDDQHPLHSTNLLVCLFTLLSAVANQLLLQAKLKPGYDSEDECVLCFFRFVMVSVSILPFSTAMCFLSAVLFHLKSVVIYFLVGIPTVLGWGTVTCVPLFVCCDDEM